MSGKKARKLRKEKQKLLFSKRAVAMCAAVCVGSVSLANGGDFIVSVYPQVSKPFGTKHEIQYGVGAGAKLTYRPFDFLNIFAYGDYSSLALPNVDPITLVDGGLGFGYHQAITDRIAFDVNLEAGAYNAKSKSSLSGMTGGVSLTFTYKFNPVISTDVRASAAHYASGSSPLMTINAGVAPGLSINLTEVFNNKAKVDFETQDLAPVFPVLYGWYENNSFGKVKVTNREDAAITDVTVSFYQPQYMGHPKECGTFTTLGKGESVDVDLYAFFNEQMLELTEKTDTQARVIVSYSCLGQKRTQTFNMTVPVYGRNNMSWDDDRRAAVFVSSKDPAALLFAKYITSIVRDNVRNGVPANIQYAMGIFEALDQFGLSYVIDPSSAFEDNVGTSSIDFLQFPYQTLMYRGGDCDDISILVCSLFEAVGIKTAFITIPGHIFMAFDSGLNVHQAQNAFSSLHDFIIDGDEVWVPLEITLSDEGFNKAWRVGAREWNTADMAGAAALYKMHDSWEIYQPVSVPGASAFFTMPDRKIVAKLFDHSVDEWINKEIETQVQMYQAKLTVKDDYETRNSLGVLYGKYGLFIQADEQFKKGRRDGYVPSIINTGNLYFSMSDYERASKWYKSVLKSEPDNVLALLGVARCAYELTNYAECDAAYERVKELDEEVALEYAYLGTFVSSKGRAFSLADRLQNTIWSEEKEEIPETVKEIFQEETTQEVLKEDPLSDIDIDDLFDFNNDMVALAPETGTEEEEDLEDYDISNSAGGNDPDNPPDDFQSEEPEEQAVQAGDEVIAENEVEVNLAKEIDITYFTEGFTGLVSEVSLLDEADFIFEEPEEEEITLSSVPASLAKKEAAPANESVSESVEKVAAAAAELIADTVTAVVKTAEKVAELTAVTAAAVETATGVAAAAPVAAETVAVAEAASAVAEVVEHAAGALAAAPEVEPALVQAEAAPGALAEAPAVETTPDTLAAVPEVEAAVEAAVTEEIAVAEVVEAEATPVETVAAEVTLADTVEPAPVEAAVTTVEPVVEVEPALVQAEAAPDALAEAPAVEAAVTEEIAVAEVVEAEAAPVETVAVEVTLADTVAAAPAVEVAVAATEPVPAVEEPVVEVEPALVQAEAAPDALAEAPAVEVAVEPAVAEESLVAAEESAVAEAVEAEATPVETVAAEVTLADTVEPAPAVEVAVETVEPAPAVEEPVVEVEPALVQAEAAPVALAEAPAVETTPDTLAAVASAVETLAPVEPTPAALAAEAPAVEAPVAAPVEAPAVAAEAPAVEPALPAAPVIIPETKFEVPRFTTQPSEEWAPEAAYFADTIPGMRSFEEEMGDFQNNKSFLYEEEFTLSGDPDTDKEEDTLTADDTKYANAGIPDVNPFSSYLSEEDAKIVEQITNFTLDDIRQKVVEEETPVIQKVTFTQENAAALAEVMPSEVEPAAPVEITADTVITTPAAEETEKTAVTENTKITVEETHQAEIINSTEENKKTLELKEDAQKEKTVPVRGLLALATAVLAGGAGVTVAVKNKKKKDEE